MSEQGRKQEDRFKKAARDVEADQSDDALDRVFGKLDPRRKPEPKDHQASEDSGEE